MESSRNASSLLNSAQACLNPQMDPNLVSKLADTKEALTTVINAHNDATTHPSVELRDSANILRIFCSISSRNLRSILQNITMKPLTKLHCPLAQSIWKLPIADFEGIASIARKILQIFENTQKILESSGTAHPPDIVNNPEP